MSYSKLHAYVRTQRMSDVEKALQRAGAEGFSFCRVLGVGEYADYFGATRTVEHVRVEVFVESDRIDEVIEAICHAARTGLPGDGIVAVMPVESVVRIRTSKANDRATST